MAIDQIQINFNESSLLIMNIVIGFIMFGVALDLKLEDFKRTLKNPKPAFIGLFSQFFLLPAFTYLLVIIIKPLPLKANQWMKHLSIILFLGFIVIMLANNYNVFIQYIGAVVIIVIVHNAVAITVGYSSARILKVGEADRRAIAIETGIQNSGLGLILIFNFFGGLGGMAMVAAWWGIWHIVSGLIVATYWSRRHPDGKSITNIVGEGVLLNTDK